jgi:hypothetical protein
MGDFNLVIPLPWQAALGKQSHSVEQYNILKRLKKFWEELLCFKCFSVLVYAEPRKIYKSTK